MDAFDSVEDIQEVEGGFWLIVAVALASAGLVWKICYEIGITWSKWS